jgi:ribosome-binding factor A
LPERSEVRTGAPADGRQLFGAMSSALGEPMGRRSAHAGFGPSQRQLRVGEELRHVLAELLMRGGLREPALAKAQLTISEVRVSADLRHALVFVTELGGELQAEHLQALERSAPQLRGEAARRMRLKYAPELTFRPDRSFAEAARIEALLVEERAAVGSASHEDDDGAE